MIKFRDNRVFVIGDTHSVKAFKQILDRVPDGVDVIHIGDVGIGFDEAVNLPYYKAILSEIDDKLGMKNCKCYAIRGNHDNPAWWPKEYDNLLLVDDYTFAEFKDGTRAILVGGEVSIDRVMRAEGVSYWEGEATKPLPKGLGEADIVFAHGCPSRFNNGSDTIPTHWHFFHKKDPKLLGDAVEQRKILDEVEKACKPKFWVYGHHHNDAREDKDGLKAFCINEAFVKSFTTKGELSKNVE